MSTMPYEILLRGSADGTLRGAHVIEAAGQDARPVTEAELALFAPGIQSGLLARIAELEAALAAAQNPGGPTPGAISKLTLKRRLEALGKWSAFKAFLAGIGETAVDEFNLAIEIRQNDEMFQQLAPLAKAALGLTDEQYTALLTP